MIDDPYDFYLNSVKGLTSKMKQEDYVYLSEKIWEFTERIDIIKKR